MKKMLLAMPTVRNVVMVFIQNVANTSRAARYPTTSGLFMAGPPGGR
jgi:hypothetical protein